MQRILAALVPDSTRGGRFVGEELTRHLEVVLGCNKVKSSLFYQWSESLVERPRNSRFRRRAHLPVFIC